MPYFASAAKKRMSQWSVIVNPMPIAWPLTAAITGFRTCHAVIESPAALNVGSSLAANVSAPARRSAPAQNAGGVPVSTTARIASSWSHRRYASESISAISPLNALRTSGRCNVIVATPSATSNSTVITATSEVRDVVAELGPQCAEVLDCAIAMLEVRPDRRRDARCSRVIAETGRDVEPRILHPVAHVRSLVPPALRDHADVSHADPILGRGGIGVRRHH